MNKPISAVNDFVVKFANVNGSGSASANALFAKSILRMGVAVAARNIFPSNIQGLPTWYEVRVSGHGWLGRRGGVDLVAPMNPQTWDADMQEVGPGGYALYDSTKPLPASKFREDVTNIGVPFTELVNAAFTDPRQKQLFKNMAYVGALAALLEIDFDVLRTVIGEQFPGKERLIAPNVQALTLGMEYVRAHIDPIGLKIRRADIVGERIFVEGNQAAALGAVYGGASVCAWYPITPSTSLAEAFQNYCENLRVEPDTGKARYAIVQAEDEIASIGIVIGAGWNGARAFTATSGPGISLMTEFIGLSYFAEIPAVIFDVQRGGPSTGMPTRTQQADLIAAAYAGHGDTKHPLLFPADPTECFEMGALAFDLADRLQTVIFVMLDLDLGMQEWLCAPFKWDDRRKFDRGKVMSFEDLETGRDFGRYLDVDGDGIAYRTYPGVHPHRGAYFTRGTSRDEYARYSEDGQVYVRNMERLLKKWETARQKMPKPVRVNAARKTSNGVIYFGSSSPAVDEARSELERQDIYIDALRVRGFPFSAEVFDFIEEHDQVFVVEQNRDAQLKQLLVNEGALDPKRLISVLHYDGAPITARAILKSIGDRLVGAPLGARAPEHAK